MRSSDQEVFRRTSDVLASWRGMQLHVKEQQRRAHAEVRQGTPEKKSWNRTCFKTTPGNSRKGAFFRCKPTMCDTRAQSLGANSRQQEDQTASTAILGEKEGVFSCLCACKRINWRAALCRQRTSPRSALLDCCERLDGMECVPR